MQLFQALRKDKAIRREMIAMSLLNIVVVLGISVWMAIPWWIALPVLVFYLAAYPVLATILTRARIQLVRRVLLMTWGINIWLGLCIVAILVRGTTALCSLRATGTPLLWASPMVECENDFSIRRNRYNLRDSTPERLLTDAHTKEAHRTHSTNSYHSEGTESDTSRWA